MSNISDSLNLHGIQVKKRNEWTPISLAELERFKRWLQEGKTITAPLYSNRGWDKRKIGKRVYRIEKKWPHVVDVSWACEGGRKYKCMPYAFLYGCCYGDHEGVGYYLMLAVREENADS